jgi:hypothetical protein
MMRKYYIALGLLASFCLLAVGLLAIVPPRHRINRDGHERIQVGMTEKEVESILRRPAGEYCSGFVLSPKSFGTPSQFYVRPEPTYWTSDEGEIAVCFEDGRVTHCEFDEVYVVRATPLEKIRRWLKL